MKTKINSVPRHDGGGEVPLREKLSIYFHPK